MHEDFYLPRRNSRQGYHRSRPRVYTFNCMHKSSDACLHMCDHVDIAWVAVALPVQICAELRGLAFLRTAQ